MGMRNIAERDRTIVGLERFGAAVIAFFSVGSAVSSDWPTETGAEIKTAAEAINRIRAVFPSPLNLKYISI
jgi:hypothetical protein